MPDEKNSFNTSLYYILQQQVFSFRGTKLPQLCNIIAVQGIKTLINNPES
jgi:hypothetical protein